VVCSGDRGGGVHGFPVIDDAVGWDMAAAVADVRPGIA
jgi:hypothetical protein